MTGQKLVKLIIYICVGLAFGVALYLRTALPYSYVFTDVGIKYSGVDAYSHMRIIDNLVHNFPHLNVIDPYALYPGVAILDRIHFFDWFLAGIIWLAGAGSPTEHLVAVISAYFPAVLGALTVIPVFFLGKALFGRWAGVIAAIAIAIMPGEFFGRSIIGFTDHHVAEVFLTAISMLFLVLALKSARQHAGKMGYLPNQWLKNPWPIIYSLLGGIFLGLYLITWAGALLFVFITAVYVVVQSILDHLKGQPLDYLGAVGVFFYIPALIIFLPFSPGYFYVLCLFVAFLIPPAAVFLSRFFRSKGFTPAFYPFTILGIGLLGLAVIYFTLPNIYNAIVVRFTIFAPAGLSNTINEMRPFLFPEGTFTFVLPWGNYTTGAILGVIGLALVIFLVIKRNNPALLLLAIWMLVILAATLGQRRFAYYLAINVALLSGYVGALILQVANVPESVNNDSKLFNFSVDTLHSSHTMKYLNGFLGVLIVFFFVVFPNIGPTITVAHNAFYAPSDAWVKSLTWLKGNTPEPFADKDFYYAQYDATKDSKPSYAVASWWDYGYWITQIGHRVPDTNPAQERWHIDNIAKLLLSDNETLSENIIQEMESKYIIIDNSMVTSKLWAVAEWSGANQTQFYDTYVVQTDKNLIQVTLFYPEYYRSLSVRLYTFDGKAVAPENIKVIGFEQKTTSNGQSYKLVTDYQEFNTLSEAQDFINKQKSTNYRIISDDPYISAIPLDASPQYTLIHGEGSIKTTGGSISEVKIFEYQGQLQ